MYPDYTLARPNKRLQRTGISVSLIDNLPHDCSCRPAAEAQRYAASLWVTEKVNAVEKTIALGLWNSHHVRICWRLAGRLI
jgi:hypothetical protein